MITVETPNPRARRSRAALTRCRRWALADGCPAGGRPTQQLLRALRAFDPALELYWHPRRERWILYRRVYRAAAPSEDVLCKVFELTGRNDEFREPGWWLITWLQHHDTTRGGALDIARATREYVEDIRRNDQAVEDRREVEEHELAEHFVKRVETYALNERHHFDMKRDKLQCQKDLANGSKRMGSKSAAP